MTHEARRRHVNECLIKIMSHRVAAECSKMAEGGASIDRINAVLPSMIQFYDQWRADVLQRVMGELDDRPTDDVAPSRLH